jgi:hypothetical protein
MLVRDCDCVSVTVYTIQCLIRCLLSWYFLTFKEPRNRFQGIDSASLCSPGGPVRQNTNSYLVPSPHSLF